MLRHLSSVYTSYIFILGTLLVGVQASQLLTTSTFSYCLPESNVTVQNLYIQYNNNNRNVTFNVSGTSKVSQNVTAQLNITAYGIPVYQKFFNPCDEDTFVDQLCPLPAGTYSAVGTQTVPAQYASQIPSVAFTVPDIQAEATLELKSLNTGEDVACIVSSVGNGKTASVPAVSYVAAGIAASALAVGGFSALGAAAGGVGGGTGGGAGTLSPSFTQVLTTMQGFAMNGMMSVQYPDVYRSFAKNFGFSVGLFPWKSLQVAIDNFRAATGGNLTEDSVQFLNNSTLVYTSTSPSLQNKRHIGLMLRDAISTTINGTTPTGSSNASSKVQNYVSGIKAYAEQLSVPQANTFMTVLLLAAVVVAAIAVGILFFKVILETWALFGSFPESLKGFRKHYWGTMARTIVNLILVLYGIWTLYCIFQFTHGDSWAAKLLAGLTLGIFTAILAFFTFMIWKTARQLKKEEGDASGLYQDKTHWLRYSLFYDSYKQDFWWLFLPVIIYMFAKGCVLGAADGHGLSQTIAQLVIECLMLSLLLWNRPYERKSGNVISIFIQVVRVLSVVCILVFVEELGIAQTTKTVTGVILIAVQSLLTGLLATLIAVNALIMCCKENPHRKRRKEAEKLNSDIDDLTPLDARNSLLMDPAKMNPTFVQAGSLETASSKSVAFASVRPYTPHSHRVIHASDRQDQLIPNAAPFGGAGANVHPPPTVPQLPDYGQYRGRTY